MNLGLSKLTVLSFLLVILAISPNIAVAAGLQASINTVEVSQQTPAPGEPVTFDVSIENFQSSSEALEITAIAIRDLNGGITEYARITDVGTVIPGDAKTIPLTATFEESGRKDLRVIVYGENAVTGDNVQYRYPVQVTVDERHPRLEIETDDAVVGGETTGTVTVANGLATSISNVEVTVDGENVEMLDARTVRAQLGAGTSMKAPFRFRPSSPGSHELTATVRYTVYGDTERVVERSTTIQVDSLRDGERLVDENSLQVDVNAEQSVAGVRTNGTVTIANGRGEPVTDLAVRVGGDEVTIVDDRTVKARLASGETTVVPFLFRASSAGENRISATVEYTTGGTVGRSVTETTTVNTEPLEHDVELGTTVRDGSAGRRLTVTLFNAGNAPIKDVVINVSDSNAVIERALDESIGAGESRRIEFDEPIPRTGLEGTVTAAYTIGTDQRRTESRIDVPARPTNIELTGVEVTEEGDRVHISGSASNLGTTDLKSVLVTVKETETVTPATPNKDYFVGTVPASDFVSFELYAETTANATAIPVQITYLVDGDRRQRTTNIQLTQGETADAGGSTTKQSGLSQGIALLVGGVVIVAVLGILAVAWRNADGGD